MLQAAAYGRSLNEKPCSLRIYANREALEHTEYPLSQEDQSLMLLQKTSGGA